jgi:hypothetical protein
MQLIRKYESSFSQHYNLKIKEFDYEFYKKEIIDKFLSGDYLFHAPNAFYYSGRGDSLFNVLHRSLRLTMHNSNFTLVEVRNYKNYLIVFLCAVGQDIDENFKTLITHSAVILRIENENSHIRNT